MVDEPHFPNSRLTDLMHKTFKTVLELRVRKGAEYAGDHVDDALANFRRNAKDAGVSMEVCWRIYAGKHWDAISQYVRDTDKNYFTRERMEPIEGRVDDLIVYLILFKAMVIERTEIPNPRYLVTGKEVKKLDTDINPLLRAHQEHYGKNQVADNTDPNPWIEPKQHPLTTRGDN